MMEDIFQKHWQEHLKEELIFTNGYSGGIITLTKQDVEANPNLIWNGFVHIIAQHDNPELSAVQRPAALVFLYENEVQNGGHYQYFENYKGADLVETIEALGILNATVQQQILREAGEVWFSCSREPVESVQEFCDRELDGEFSSFDSRFYDCVPNLVQCMDAYLRSHLESFIRIV